MSSATDAHLEHYRLYVQTNRSFIEEKFDEMFKMELQDDSPQLTTVDQSKLEKLVREVFAFQDNVQLQQFYKQLTISIAKFCEQEKQLDGDAIMELLFYCLDNSIEKQDKKDNVEQQYEQNAPQEPEVQQTKNQQVLVEIPKFNIANVLQKTIDEYQQLLKKSNLSKDERLILQSSLANTKIQQLSIKSDTRKRKVQSVMEKTNEDMLDPEVPCYPLITKRDLLLKRLKPIFKFVCSEQQSTGSTFDRISKQGSHMNLGKFLIFCNTLKICSQKLTRFVLIQKFKKNAQFVPEIDFDKFVTLLDTLNQIDNTLFSRIMADAQANKKIRLKSIRVPFAMREKDNFRAINIVNSARKDLTSHSGQLSYSLREELQSRKLLKSQRQRYGEIIPSDKAQLIANNSFQGEVVMPELMQASHLSEPAQQRSIYTIGQLKGEVNQTELKRLSRLIVNDESDDDFLQNYGVQEFKSRRNSNIITNIRKRAQQVSKLEHQKQMKGQQRLQEIKSFRVNKLK